MELRFGDHQPHVGGLPASHSDSGQSTGILETQRVTFGFPGSGNGFCVVLSVLPTPRWRGERLSHLLLTPRGARGHRDQQEPAPRQLLLQVVATVQRPGFCSMSGGMWGLDGLLEPEGSRRREGQSRAGRWPPGEGGGVYI